ncbi:MAG: Tfp pilus assembly protein FimT/FimU [Candidatus Methylacidiphilales bacterium]|nr:type II secretion system protein [Candidatus Methylacidiphilales bacterium]
MKKTFRTRNARRHQSGFTLIELLAVMTIIGVLASAGLQAMTRLSGSSEANRTISGVTATLDMARQHAVAHNTYTWVIFAANPATTEGFRLYVTVLESRDGTNMADANTPVDLDASATYQVGGTSGNLVLAQKMEIYRGAQITPLASSSPAPILPEPSAPNATVSFRIPDTTASQAVAYLNSHPEAQRIVQFSPTGQARIASSISQVIELGLQPMKGTIPDAANSVAIQINGFTGQTRVYRK